MSRGKKKEPKVLLTADQAGALGANAKKDIVGSFENCLLSKRMIDTENENIGDILENLEGKHGIPKKLARKVITMVHAGKSGEFDEETRMLAALLGMIESGTTAEEEAADSKKKGLTAKDVLSGT